MNIPTNKNNITFKANLIISDKNKLLTQEEISKLKHDAKKLGTPDDIIHIDIASEIMDTFEVNEINNPKKILSGYKLQIESTINNFEQIDASVAKTQQTFWENFYAVKPFAVLENIFKNFQTPENITTIQKAINDNPEIYNAKNTKWINNTSIQTPDITPPLVTRYFENSPMYKALSRMDSELDTPVKIAVIDVFDKGGMALSSSIKYDEPHGNFVHAILNQFTQDRNPKIDTYNVINMKDHPCSFNPKSLLKTLKKLQGQNYDYLNLSVYYPREYTVSGIKFSPDELHTKSDELRKEIPKTILHIIEEIEKLIQSGCEVYIAGGNKPDKFNILSLAKGAHNIGGDDPNPLKTFTSNTLIETQEKLPVYIRNATTINTERPIMDYPFKRDLSRLSKRELFKRIAKPEDYETLKTLVDKISQNGKYKFDINFLSYKIAFALDKNLRGKIFEIEKYKKIFENLFSNDVLENITPQGTHCDVQFSQFFDMNSKNAYIISQSKTTKVLKAISGSSFATPQALSKNLHLDYLARDMVAQTPDICRFMKTILNII